MASTTPAIIVIDDAGIAGEGVRAVQDVHVGAADPGPAHSDQHVVLADGFRWVVPHLQPVRLLDRDRHHPGHSLVSCILGYELL